MANSIAYAQKFLPVIDDIYKAASVTAGMDTASRTDSFTGVNEVKVLKVSTTGLGDYSREDGYPKGDVTASWETMKLTEERGKEFSVDRLVCILFPELEKLVPTLHMASVYALLSEFPGAHQISTAHLTHLKSVLSDASKGRYDREKAVQIRDAARNSIGSRMPAKSLELKHTIRLIRELDGEIEEIEKEINSIMDEIHSPITTIPGISTRMGAMILAEVGDFSNFDSADKILAYAGMSPSTYQSGQLTNCYSHMEKRGSKYLRYAIFNATKYVCHWDPSFAAYLAKKRTEGKHYNVAISHAAKKLLRLIYAMEKSQQPYRQSA